MVIVADTSPNAPQLRSPPINASTPCPTQRAPLLIYPTAPHRPTRITQTTRVQLNLGNYQEHIDRC